MYDAVKYESKTSLINRKVDLNWTRHLNKWTSPMVPSHGTFTSPNTFAAKPLMLVSVI